MFSSLNGKKAAIRITPKIWALQQKTGAIKQLILSQNYKTAGFKTGAIKSGAPAKTLVPSGHVNPQILGVIRIAAFLPFREENIYIYI